MIETFGCGLARAQARHAVSAAHPWSGSLRFDFRKIWSQKKNGDVAEKKDEKKELKTERGRERETETSAACQGGPRRMVQKVQIGSITIAK